MKRAYDGLEAHWINLNTISTSASQCDESVLMENTGSGTCDDCGPLLPQHEGYTKEV